ncbi:MAG: hypothetical protein LBV06_00035 [Propionibacteriaceae bacterium]|jgi:predicted nucleic acid-binding protein|nr:hypothetical protein [Propionibacteriaceae bacterium]
MKILLDTNLLIAPLRTELLPASEDGPIMFYCAALSLAELQEGEFSSDPAVRLRAPLDYVRITELLGEGLPFDDLAAHVYRVVCQAVADRGRHIMRTRRVDLMIAAVALANDCVLATRNIADFAGLEPLLTVMEL